MKTGDLLRDAQGRSYQLGPLLGRGIWGKSYDVREEGGSIPFVLKAPLSRDDLDPEHPAPADILEACRRAVEEQADLLEEAPYPFLPRLHARFRTEEGIPVYVVPRFAFTLERRLADGIPLRELLDLLIAVTRHLVDGGEIVHGDLRASNILLGERGDVHLADLATGTVVRLLPRLASASPQRTHHLPPEVLTPQGAARLDTGADTWAMGALLYRALLSEAGQPAAPTPRKGPDKADLVQVRERVRERARREGANERFLDRLGDRCATLLARALSWDVSPSPPFRFRQLDEFLGRLEELRSLIQPRISSVGRLLPGLEAGQDHFTTDDEPTFTVSVGATPGVDRPEQLGVGLAVHDRDGGERLADVPSRYTADRLPSGRFRFRFRLGRLPPGSYHLKTVFFVQGSGELSRAAEADFEVHPLPGYVPPPSEPVEEPIPFPAPEAAAPAPLPPAEPEEPPPPEPPPPADHDEPAPAEPPAPATSTVVSEAPLDLANLPLPGPTGADEGRTDPAWSSGRSSRLDRLVERLRDDPYYLFMTVGVVLLLIVLVVRLAIT